MSQATVLSAMASVHLPEACAVASAAAGLPDFDTDVFSASAKPYPSCRLAVLDEFTDSLGLGTLVQISLRIPANLIDEWKGSKFRQAFSKALGFANRSSELSRMAYLPAFDYEQSDDAPPQLGTFRLVQAGSRLWRLSWDGPETRLFIAQLNLYSQGD